MSAGVLRQPAVSPAAAPEIRFAGGVGCRPALVPPSGGDRAILLGVGGSLIYTWQLKNTMINLYLVAVVAWWLAQTGRIIADATPGLRRHVGHWWKPSPVPNRPDPQPRWPAAARPRQKVSDGADERAHHGRTRQVRVSRSAWSVSSAVTELR